MLSSLSLNNVALFKKQTIDFQSGLNCLLGKSGAGKSIIIDALSFCFGAKSDKNLIRSGETSLRVDAVFTDVPKEVEEMLKEQDIEISDELIITRTLNLDGKSSIKINGFPVSVRVLQSLTEMLIDFCGQHESVGLLNVNNHLLLLDKFGGQNIEVLREDVEKIFQTLSNLKAQKKSFGGDEKERERRKEILSFQIQEIENANLDLIEEEELRQRFEFISSAEKIFDKVGQSVSKLDEQRDNVSSLLYDVKMLLNSLSNFKNIEECRDRVENCYYEIKDIAETLNTIKSESEFDQNELERIDARLDLIKSLKKKYGSSIEDVLDFLQECKTELGNLENSEFELEKINRKIEETEKELETACQKLSAKRKECATIFEKQIMEQLADLEMKNTIFKVDFTQTECSKKGFDTVKFMFSANKGQELKDLSKTASGGELSRLLLAFKNTMLDKERVQTVVFDEIDAGISGHTAGQLAEKISNISKFTQVLCITHTPIVASKANAFVLVEKSVIENSTISTARTLNPDEAVEEVAKLIDGGSVASKTALEHARKLFAE